MFGEVENRVGGHGREIEPLVKDESNRLEADAIENRVETKMSERSI